MEYQLPQTLSPCTERQCSHSCTSGPAIMSASERESSLTTTLKNKNVKLALAYTFLSSASRGIWAFVTLSNFINVLTGSTLNVGFAEAVQGCSQAIFALLGGYLADKYSRSAVLKGAGVVGVLACGVAIFMLVYNSGKGGWMTSYVRYDFVVGFLAMWGAYQGLGSTALETIFADSVATGKRSEFSTRKFMFLQIASITGPIIAICLFLYKGNHWHINTLSTIFLIGIVLSLPSVMLLFFFSDQYTLGISSESHSSPKVKGDKTDQDLLIVPFLSEGDSNMDVEVQSRGSNDELSRLHRIPYVLGLSDVVSGISAGMTVKFFPLFFANEIGLSPVFTNAIYVGLPLVMAAMARGFQYIGRVCGRVETAVIMSIVGALSLITLWWFVEHVGPNMSPTWLIILLYVLSTSQHCVRPLKKSLLMDYVPKRKRGVWNAVDSVTRFGWSGSALLGGWIIHYYGYGTSFLYTGILQIVAAFILALLIPLVPGNEQKRAASS